MEKILIVEDDVWIANSLKLYLSNSGFTVDLIHDWGLAVEKILNNKYSIVILDVNLPNKNWMEICEEVREKSLVPIIMLTARTQENDRIKWLEIWADDYISKPFSPRELLARIKTILRRSDNNIKKSQNLIFWDLEINVNKNIVLKNWKEINLTKNEFDILKKIVQEDWNIVKRETLMKDIIWYDDYAFDRTIDTHIKNLRKKIWNKDMIVTVRWVWYRINK